jgi:type IV pilus assembly protein PilW
MRTARVSQIAPRRQRGYSLVELSVAVMIALFLIGGLLVVVQDNKRVFGNQSSLSELQDSERLAMTIMTDVIQSAGYFPNPVLNTSAGEFAQAAPFTAYAGQSIVGTGTYGAGNHTLTVRYATASGDTIINCAGTSNTSGAPHVYRNAFAVVNGQLQCTLTIDAQAPTTYPLVGSPKVQVTALNVLYGVNTTGGPTGNNVDSYIDATSMTAAQWQQVKSIMIRLTFANPLYSAAAGQVKQKPTIDFTRVVDVMAVGGVSTS